jgi:hypothetical protein
MSPKTHVLEAWSLTQVFCYSNRKLTDTHAEFLNEMALSEHAGRGYSDVLKSLQYMDSLGAVACCGDAGKAGHWEKETLSHCITLYFCNLSCKSTESAQNKGKRIFPAKSAVLESFGGWNHKNASNFLCGQPYELFTLG